MKKKNTVKTGILGVTGFTGEKLVELILKHPLVKITYLTARVKNPIPYAKLFPKFKGRTDLFCEALDFKKALKIADIFFLALPHTVSLKIVPYLFKEGKKVIDLSADYRLKDPEVYEKYYKAVHGDKKNLKTAVYGLAEFLKTEIKKSRLVANPGCYPVSVILPLTPLLKENLVDLKIIVDAKSSITGAGRKPLIDYHYTNISNNLWAYKPFIHQHVPEITTVLKSLSGKKIDFSFVPHAVGVEGGIYSTIYVYFKKKMDEGKLFKIYDKYYANTPFVRVRENLPRLKDVVGTNFCDIGFSLDAGGKKGVICSCIDNLIKGAAGNAIQNMNLMCGFKETSGLL